MTVNAMFLGILGEYVGRIFLQSKNLNRPLVEIELNGNGQRNDAVPKGRRTMVEAAE